MIAPLEVQILVLPPEDVRNHSRTFLMTINQIAGIIPALVFPTATLMQLARMIRARSAAGVSGATWSLFGFANLAIYVYAERYTEWQAIVGMLVTAGLDFVIAALALRTWRGRNEGQVAPLSPAPVPSEIRRGGHPDPRADLPPQTAPAR